LVRDPIFFSLPHREGGRERNICFSVLALAEGKSSIQVMGDYGFLDFGFFGIARYIFDFGSPIFFPFFPKKGIKKGENFYMITELLFVYLGVYGEIEAFLFWPPF
jgi:hypothetical protein